MSVLSANEYTNVLHAEHTHKHQTMKIASIIALCAPLCAHNKHAHRTHSTHSKNVEFCVLVYACLYTCFLKHHHDLWRIHTQTSEREHSTTATTPFAERMRHKACARASVHRCRCCVVVVVAVVVDDTRVTVCAMKQ